MRIPLGEYNRFVKHANGATREAAVRGLYAAAMRLVAMIKSEIIPNESRIPVDRGIYRNGWRAEKSFITTATSSSVNKRFVGAIIRNAVPYAVIIEKGARAENIKIGKKMIDALTEWVKRKGFGTRVHQTTTVSKRSKKIVTKTKVVKISDADARKIAWAIAKSMQKKGIFNEGKGLRILEKALEKAPGIINDEITREMARSLARTIK